MLRSWIVIPTVLACGVATIAPRRFGTDVRIVSDEPRAAIDIIGRAAQHQPIDSTVWRRLFDSQGYRALVARDSAFGVPRNDEAFGAFLLSDSLSAIRELLRARVEAMAKLDVGGAARQALAYAPRNARIRATIFPVIKPASNSFVFGPDSAPQIFLFVNVNESAAHFRNRLTHELHHVALNTACPEDPDPSLPEPVHALVRNLGGFGEGLAMLAAAGGPRVDANAESDSATRSRWNRDVAWFPENLTLLQRFIRDVVEGRITTRDSVRHLASTFYGVQGPWYTVGWRMAATIEEQLGRPTLIAAMCDPRRLMSEYNIAARRANTAQRPTLPTWDDRLLARLWPPSR